MDTNWVSLSLDQIGSYLSQPQLDAINAQFLPGDLPNGTPDRYSLLLAPVMARIRVKIAANPKNQLSATDATIPLELQWVAAALVIESMSIGLSTLELTKDQKDWIKRAYDELAGLAKTDGMSVTMPTDPVTVPTVVQLGAQTEQVSGDTRTATTNSMQGL